jgi:ABC-type uncharacterized transport system substrate-binding protein
MALGRREFLAGLGGAVWPVMAQGQQPVVPVVGFLTGATAWEYAQVAAAFRQGLAETGFIENRNVLVEYRWAEGRYERLPTLAADLVVNRRASAIAAGGFAATLAARAATQDIPIVFQLGVDPVEAGLVASLNRPNGNLTGITTLGAELWPKRLELLRELLPTARTFAVLVNPTNASAETGATNLQAIARTLGLELHVLHARNEREIDDAFMTAVQLRAGGLEIGGDAFFNTRSEQLGSLTLRHTLPTIHEFRDFVTAGGLMSYGSSLTDAARQAGIYIGRIVKGEKAADLPVQQATKVELFINMKTAKALGLTFPITLLGRADEVIE